MFGYDEVSCRKKKGLRIEWRPIQKDTQGENNIVQIVQTINKQTSDALEVFTEVSERVTAKQSMQSTSHITPVLGNPFQALDIADNEQNSSKSIPNGKWENNSTPNIKGRLWIAWNPRQYEEDLLAISQQMNEAWCILGDFNVVLYKEDRRGGNVIQDNETKEMTDFMENGDL
ncbi:hypothetical protein Cgig2_023897 [Carnegiea gigantea]|uniref:Uncharacterized protein n=1 Tax=Carnegiea gigantea TaxID=171969 RepID=A0A9Q1JLY0_9CARY|nr:hypothetical protein Cgig2_023897 [Carnegiea gigantea]